MILQGRSPQLKLEGRLGGGILLRLGVRARAYVAVLLLSPVLLLGDSGGRCHGHAEGNDAGGEQPGGAESAAARPAAVPTGRERRP